LGSIGARSAGLAWASLAAAAAADAAELYMTLSSDQMTIVQSTLSAML